MVQDGLITLNFRAFMEKGGESSFPREVRTCKNRFTNIALQNTICK